MCRNFNMTMNAVQLKDILFEPAGNDGYHLRPGATVHNLINERTSYIQTVAEDCSKKSTKAGYDAAGMAVGIIPLATLVSKLNGGANGRVFTDAEAADFCEELAFDAEIQTKVARDGGDLLLTWDALVDELKLQPTDYIINWTTHVRQASQGDMYSKGNAHPHRDIIDSDRVRIYRLQDGKLTVSEEAVASEDSLFYDTHNGDINDARRYKALLEAEGFRFFSNSDSCVEPALKRFIYEHLRHDSLVGLLHYLAQIDPDFIAETNSTVDETGNVEHYQLGMDYAHQTVLVQQAEGQLHFRANNQHIAAIPAHSLLHDDTYGTKLEKIGQLLALADTLKNQGAELVTIALALTARIFEYSNNSSKFTFQSFAPVNMPANKALGGGTYAMLRGGSRCGGEEGGELVFHLPKPYDTRNYSQVAFLSASEENALKEQVELLDAAAIEHGEIKIAEPEVEQIDFLHGIRATAYITEGMMPIFDVLPGEIVEVSADGKVRLFDLYDGHEIKLMEHYNVNVMIDDSGIYPKRHERLAPLKIFKVDYFNDVGDLVECPYNKYGEEIFVVQPLALRRNSEKLFYTDPNDPTRVRTSAERIGLLMGTADDALRRERVRQLTHIVSGAAGTSYLINAIAADMARKLRVHTLQTVNVDGFTGSDTVPTYISNKTLFMANSNSGGTSDTIRLTHEVGHVDRVVKRLEETLAALPTSAADLLRPTVERLKTELVSGKNWKDLPDELYTFVEERMPWVFAVTNIEASVLGNIGGGLDPNLRAAGAGITNLPEEESVGSTFAALASLQWQMALHTFIGELRGDISEDYAAYIYGELAKLPDVATRIVGNKQVVDEVGKMSDELVGGNYDFVYTGYVEGVPEEQAHKGAEMIQEMFAGWNFFQFQHGKYAHMKRRSRYALGSVLGHNCPPPSWSFFNARALKSPREIGPRVANVFVIAHESDRHYLESIPDYAPDYVFTYPEDSIPLYPFQVLLVGHLISYLWGQSKKDFSQKIQGWNQGFLDKLTQLPPSATTIPADMKTAIADHAYAVLQEFADLCETTPRFDRVEGRRKNAIMHALALLAQDNMDATHTADFTIGGFLQSDAKHFSLYCEHIINEPITDADILTAMKDVALELSTVRQAKQLADHFLVDENGSTLPLKIDVSRPNNRTRHAYQYDYMIEYEGLGTLYDVEPVHPPKIAKAKKGWL